MSKERERKREKERERERERRDEGQEPGEKKDAAARDDAVKYRNPDAHIDIDFDNATSAERSRQSAGLVHASTGSSTSSRGCSQSADDALQRARDLI